MLSRRCSCYPEKKTSKQTNKHKMKERLVAVYKRGADEPSPILRYCSHCANAKRLKLLIRACHNESGCTVLVWARDHVDGYTVRNPKLISDHISGSGTGGLPGARNPERTTSMYSGTRLIQTLRGHAMLSVLPGCPY